MPVHPSILRFYDLLGERYDRFSFYESRAKAVAFQLLELAPGQRLLNVGLGTGREHPSFQMAVAPGGVAFGVDLSARMLSAARQRTGAPLCLADGGSLPFADASFDRLLCAYVLDLVPASEIPAWLQGFRRVLKPGSRLVLLSLTQGVDLPSRAFVGLWKLAYAASPVICGGCRPLQLTGSVEQSGFQIVDRQVIVQFGVPSEALAALC